MIINNEAIVLESFQRFVTWHACIFEKELAILKSNYVVPNYIRYYKSGSNKKNTKIIGTMVGK
jgi:hypothetical protein